MSFKITTKNETKTFSDIKTESSSVGDQHKPFRKTQVQMLPISITAIWSCSYLNLFEPSDIHL